MPQPPSRSAAALLAAALILPAALPAQAASPAFDADRAVERLREADANRDGAFARDDLPAMLASRWEGGKLAELRGQFDRNGDQRISRDEFLGAPTPAFDMADANRDDVVTEAEFRALAAKAKRN